MRSRIAVDDPRRRTTGGHWSESVRAFVDERGDLIETEMEIESRGPLRAIVASYETPTVRCHYCKQSVMLMRFGDGWTDAPHECRRSHLALRSVP